MSPKRRPAPSGPVPRRPTSLKTRRRPDGSLELVHPRCAMERVEDLEEVRSMLDHGEVEVAVDELRWLVSGCPDCLLAHRLLGETALDDQHWKLARAHFGRAFELGFSALPPSGSFRVPYALPANQAYLEAGKGLAFALAQAGLPARGLAVARLVLSHDPADPLGLASLISQLESESALRPDAAEDDVDD